MGPIKGVYANVDPEVGFIMTKYLARNLARVAGAVALRQCRKLFTAADDLGEP